MKAAIAHKEDRCREESTLAMIDAVAGRIRRERSEVADCCADIIESGLGDSGLCYDRLT